VFAVGATCTHYGGPLAEGVVAGGQVRCPWHHACFDVRTGEAVAAPAIDPLPCWRVERDGARVMVGERRPRPEPDALPAAPESVVIVGAGAAGTAAAEMLRRAGYAGPVTLIGADSAPPVDRPNLSKDYLAGNAPEAWVYMRPPDSFAAAGIDLLLNTRVDAVDTAAHTVHLADGYYDVTIAYIGHAATWDDIELIGDLAARSALAVYRSGGRIAALASVFRDQESLQAELLLERNDQAGLESLVAGWRA
jgi:hypothetical protein